MTNAGRITEADSYQRHSNVWKPAYDKDEIKLTVNWILN